MSTPIVYIALLLHCIGKNANLLICFGKMPLKGGGLGLLKFFCCLARIEISLTTAFFRKFLQNCDGQYASLLMIFM